jgi:hypothetical protein
MLGDSCLIKPALFVRRPSLVALFPLVVPAIKRGTLAESEPFGLLEIYVPWPSSAASDLVVSPVTEPRGDAVGRRDEVRAERVDEL